MLKNKKSDQLKYFFQVWLLCCTFFVFLALMEYFVVLFGIRYDSHWRRQLKAAHVQDQTQHLQPSSSKNHISNQNVSAPTSAILNLPNVEASVRVCLT